MKRLYKSKTNKVVSGLMGGLGDYLNIDPVLLRIMFIFFLLLTHVLPGVIAYIIGSLIVPDYPVVETPAGKAKYEPSSSQPKTDTATEAPKDTQ